MLIENKVKIAIIIPFFNGDQFILNCLQSLSNALKRVEIDYKIILVENNYKKSTLLDNIENKQLEIVAARPGIGFGRACNIGAIYAHKRGFAQLMFLNQDTEIGLDFFYTWASGQHFLITDTIIFPLIYNLKNREALYEIPYRAYVDDYTSFEGDFDNDKFQKYYKLNVYTGCCFIISASEFLRLGLFDPVYYMYGEDYDLFWRAKSQSFNLILLPELTVFHAGKDERTVKDRIVHSKYLVRERLINYVRWNYYYSINYQLKYIVRHSVLGVLSLVFILIKTIFLYNQIIDKDSLSISKRAFNHYNIDFISNEGVSNNTGL